MKPSESSAGGEDAYLAVTKLARLRLADTLFAQSKYQEAVQVYQSYIRRHDGAADVTYARFRVAEAHYRMVPSEFWLLPPVYEMDLSTADRARYYLEAFIRRYPTSDLVTRAHRLRGASPSTGPAPLRGRHHRQP